MGAGKHDRLKACVKQGMILSFSISLGLSVIIMLVGRPVLGILTHDQAVISTTYEMMSYFVPFYFTWSVIEVLSAVLRGAGDAVRPVAIVGVGICLFRIVWIFTAFRWFHTLPVLCYCYPASWLVTDIALFVYFRKGKWMEQGRRILEK